MLPTVFPFCGYLKFHNSIACLQNQAGPNNLNMEGVFWNIIRHQIVETIKQEPSHESLLILLKLGDPSITDADVDDETKRSSAFRKLKRLIHPDKHQDDSKCTKLFQDAQAFFESSIKELYCRPKKKPKCSHSSSSFPSSFHVEKNGLG